MEKKKIKWPQVAVCSSTFKKTSYKFFRFSNPDRK